MTRCCPFTPEFAVPERPPLGNPRAAPDLLRLLEAVQDEEAEHLRLLSWVPEVERASRRERLQLAEHLRLAMGRFRESGRALPPELARVAAWCGESGRETLLPELLWWLRDPQGGAAEAEILASLSSFPTAQEETVPLLLEVYRARFRLPEGEGEGGAGGLARRTRLSRVAYRALMALEPRMSEAVRWAFQEKLLARAEGPGRADWAAWELGPLSELAGTYQNPELVRLMMRAARARLVAPEEVVARLPAEALSELLLALLSPEGGLERRTRTVLEALERRPEVALSPEVLMRLCSHPEAWVREMGIRRMRGGGSP